MNPMNELMRASICKALGALHFLDDAGATVIDVEIRNARPVITVDGEPPRFVKGALHKSHPVNGRSTERVMVAMVQGCRVQWNVRTVRGVDAVAVEG